MAGAGTLIGTPIGILAGTYLAEYGERGWLAPATRFINDVLLSAPSIVIGLFFYTVYVSRVNHFSGWAGALALAIIVIPSWCAPPDDMLKLVPNSLREAAVALGCPTWKMITWFPIGRARGNPDRRPPRVARISGRDGAAPLHRRSTTSSGRRT
jgi:phosphate transport system permease protein